MKLDILYSDDVVLEGERWNRFKKGAARTALGTALGVGLGAGLYGGGYASAQSREPQSQPATTQSTSRPSDEQVRQSGPDMWPNIKPEDLDKMPGSTDKSAPDSSVLSQKSAPKVTPKPAPAANQSEQPQEIDRDIIISLESAGGRLSGVSSAGARGVMQIKKDAWNDTVFGMGVNWPYSDVNDAQKNMKVGTYYLNRVIPNMINNSKLPNTIESRLAIYNWGIGNVRNAYKKHGKDWIKHAPAETKSYIERYKNLAEAKRTGSHILPASAPSTPAATSSSKPKQAEQPAMKVDPAVSALRSARNYAANGMPDKAKIILADIIKKNPSSASAKEAAAMLKTME